MNLTAEEVMAIMRLIAEMKEQIDVNRLLCEQYRKERDDYRAQLEESGA